MINVELALFVILFLYFSVVVIGFIFALRELRKFHREIRHDLEVYFPASINEAAKSGAKRELQTSVEVNDAWDEREEPRS